MGSGVVVGPLLIVLFFIVAVVALMSMAPRLRHAGATTTGSRAAPAVDDASLVFRPIPGQDPAAVVLALHDADVEAVSVVQAGDVLVLIPLAQRGSREQIRTRARSAIAHGAALNLEGDEPGIVSDVRFEDEPEV